MKLSELTLLVASFNASFLSLVTAAKTSESYFIVYPGDAPADCLKEDGMQVDDTCCTDVGPQLGKVRDFFPSTCFVISGLLGEGGGCTTSEIPGHLQPMHGAQESRQRR